MNSNNQTTNNQTTKQVKEISISDILNKIKTEFHNLLIAYLLKIQDAGINSDNIHYETYLDNMLQMIKQFLGLCNSIKNL
jgi:hypothetical protein